MRLIVWWSFLAAAGTAASPPGATPDRDTAALQREIAGKGWIVYSAITERGDWDLFRSRPDGSERRNLTRTPETHEVGGRFSPDGRLVLFRRIAKDTKFNHDRWGAMGQLVIANADGTNPVAKGSAGDYPWASWSPDGRQVACLAKTGIEIRDLASGRVTRTLDRRGIYQQLFWSPDGRWFTGTANTYGENWTVIRIHAGTGEANPVHKFQNCTPDWSPDSKRIIFSSRPADQGDDEGLSQSAGQKPEYGWTQLLIADGDAANRMLVYGEDGRHIYGGALSPDGKYVLFTRAARDGGMADATIHVMRLRDAPIVGGVSAALRRRYPEAKRGPVAPVATGWEPHWSSGPAAGGK